MHRVRDIEQPNAVPIPSPSEIAARVDWRDWYLTDEADMGESPEQGEIIRLLLAALETWRIEQGWTDTYIGGDNFFGWVEAAPLVRISPDVYTVSDAPTTPPTSWQTWRPGHHAPRFAMEIVSTEWRKDYLENPQKYAQLGVDELVVFDPAAPTAHNPRRVVFQLWRRREGMLVLDEVGDGPVWSDVLGLWLHALDGAPLARRLCRLARDEAGFDLVATARELLQSAAQRAEAETQRAEAEARLRKAAEARIAELEAALERGG